MNIFKTIEDLVDKRLIVGICQGLPRTNNLMEIAFHKFFIEIDFIELSRIDDVHVIETSNLR